jgi:hypothetical protein
VTPVENVLSKADDLRQHCAQDDLAHLLAIDHWASLELPRLSDEERAWVHGRLDALCDERLARSDAHRERIIKTARHLGREVAAHRMTLADARVRSDFQVKREDTDSLVPMRLVSYAEAADVASRAFDEGYLSGSTGAVD